MTGRAYAQSARIAAAIGPYERYEENRERAQRRHADAPRRCGRDPRRRVRRPARCSTRRARAWDEAVELGEVHGYRNAQATVLAPTGTISFLMDCDTTGVEPDFSLVKFKELVGGGQMTIVNQTVPLALRTLGYDEQQIEQIDAHIDEHATIVGAPGLTRRAPAGLRRRGRRARDLAHGPHQDDGRGAAVHLGRDLEDRQPAAEATVEDIADAYMQAWHLGIKALAIYRDGSKTAQALRTDAQETRERRQTSTSTIEAAIARGARRRRAPQRNRMPRERQSITHKFSIGGHEGYITAGHVRGRHGRRDLPHRHRQGGLDAARA